MNRNLEAYRANFESIEGWCAEQLFQTIDFLDSAPINKTGGCCEIGVHHGKLFILLNQVVAPHETSFAVDVFENQDLNIDRSGKGSLIRFKENLERYDIHHGANTKIIVGDSTDPALQLPDTIGRGKLRFISIDGGHSAEHTLNDLQLAVQLIANDGVVIVDDILNYMWIGVIEGVARFLSTCPILVPFAVGHNKMYFAKLSYRDYYLQLFSKISLKTKLVQFFGHTLIAM